MENRLGGRGWWPVGSRWGWGYYIGGGKQPSALRIIWNSPKSQLRRLLHQHQHRHRHRHQHRYQHQYLHQRPHSSGPIPPYGLRRYLLIGRVRLRVRPCRLRRALRPMPFRHVPWPSPRRHPSLRRKPNQFPPRSLKKCSPRGRSWMNMSAQGRSCAAPPMNIARM